ncbi:hypothetical protein AAG747_10450 [Rapidithrix thailandica]|uniref:PepSY domain-containing protein n=1 Tax=Rapidithrix thailandica TaxID=413964 RepID=A0AAW9S7H1_9BACT
MLLNKLYKISKKTGKVEYRLVLLNQNGGEVQVIFDTEGNQLD